jgi:ribosome biogenesis GTPase
VLRALERAEVSAAHYDNFIKLRRETEHYQLSYAEKRKKDKDFGRFIKLVKRDFDGESR